MMGWVAGSGRASNKSHSLLGRHPPRERRRRGRRPSMIARHHQPSLPGAEAVQAEDAQAGPGRGSGGHARSRGHVEL